MKEINDKELSELSELFKVFGDYTRIRILSLLFNGKFGVNEIANDLGMNQSAISHQLKILKQARLVKVSRDGNKMIYELDDHHIYNIFEQGLNHIKH